MYIYTVCIFLFQSEVRIEAEKKIKSKTEKSWLATITKSESGGVESKTKTRDDSRGRRRTKNLKKLKYDLDSLAFHF